jgi:hypothetical protein
MHKFVIKQDAFEKNTLFAKFNGAKLGEPTHTGTSGETKLYPLSDRLGCALYLTDSQIQFAE